MWMDRKPLARKGVNVEAGRRVVWDPPFVLPVQLSLTSELLGKRISRKP